jgi:hypothetical protein
MLVHLTDAVVRRAVKATHRRSAGGRGAPIADGGPAPNLLSANRVWRRPTVWHRLDRTSSCHGLPTLRIQTDVGGMPRAAAGYRKSDRPDRGNGAQSCTLKPQHRVTRPSHRQKRTGVDGPPASGLTPQSESARATPLLGSVRSMIGAWAERPITFRIWTVPRAQNLEGIVETGGDGG